jgi:hypothetical protein
VTEYQRSDIRVSDTEREDALGKLGEHMSAGRLDIDEYGDRTAKVAAAKTRGEVLELFGDLPEPRPTFGKPAQLPAPAVPRTVSFAQKVAPVLLPVAGVMLVLGLVFLIKLPFFFLIPFIFFAVQSGRWRDDQRRRDHRRRMHGRWRDERY